jgi:hypothetical protein
MAISTIGQNGLTVPLTSNTITSASATALTLQSAGTTAMTINTSQNVGIGTTTINNAVTTYRGAGVNNYIQFTNSTTGTASTDGCLIGVAADDTALRLRVLEAAPMIFTTSDTERMRIDSSGNLFVGCTSSPSASVFGVQLSPVLTTAFHKSSVNSTGDIRHWGFYNTNGLVGGISTNGSATSYNTSSDYRLKENITPMVGALAKVALLKPVTYKWKADGSDGEGFIAHELAVVKPDCVSGDKDAVDADGNPQYQGVDTSFLVATLTAAIQELKTIVDAQAAEIAELKAKVA